MALQVGIVGTGRPWRTEGATGMGIANEHARGYALAPGVELAALCDLDLATAEAFRQAHHGKRAYASTEEMLANERLDIVSVCTWPGTHALLVEQIARAGVRAIHCEKPMAPNWAAAQRMVQTCAEHGVQLTFNHQRRFDPAYVKAKALLDTGRIGSLVRLEMPTGNLFDWGTHWFDMMNFWNGDTDAEWVLAAVEPTGGPTVFRVLHEGAGLVHVKYRNGVHGYVATGDHGFKFQARLVGESGAIEIGVGGWDTLRVRADDDAAWEWIDTAVPEGAPGGHQLAVLDLVDALQTSREPALSAKRALRATELIFAAYHSSAIGRRADVPLTVPDVEIRAEPTPES